MSVSNSEESQHAPPNTYVILPNLQSVFVVCKNQSQGFWVEFCEVGDGASMDYMTRRDRLRIPTYISPAMSNEREVRGWLLQTVFAGVADKLDDHSEEVVNEMVRDLLGAVRALDMVQIA